MSTQKIEISKKRLEEIIKEEVENFNHFPSRKYAIRLLTRLRENFNSLEKNMVQFIAESNTKKDKAEFNSDLEELNEKMDALLAFLKAEK